MEHEYSANTANTSTYTDFYPTHRNRNPFYQFPEFNAGPVIFFMPFLKPQLLQPNDHCKIRNLLLPWKCSSSVVKSVKIRLKTWIWQAKKKEKEDKRTKFYHFPQSYDLVSLAPLFLTVGNTTSPYTLKTHSQEKPKNINTCRYYWHELNISVHILPPLCKYGCTNYTDEGIFCKTYICATPANTQQASCTIQSHHHNHAHTNITNPHTCNFGSTK